MPNMTTMYMPKKTMKRLRKYVKKDETYYSFIEKLLDIYEQKLESEEHE